jgi:hypothetical protein
MGFNFVEAWPLRYARQRHQQVPVAPPYPNAGTLFPRSVCRDSGWGIYFGIYSSLRSGRKCASRARGHRLFQGCDSASNIYPSLNRGKPLISLIERSFAGGHDRRRLTPWPRSNKGWGINMLTYIRRGSKLDADTHMVCESVQQGPGQAL